ncbi:hypothetical protein CHH49_18130 [Terribacillus saccharophilus]|uniref:hypothetical protein n=1 Tax=Terribacillus saccharophilus TaxID=361277 RepID=UPI000BA6A39C|nr:hypothetical protein [Terribacillus saccharophilus]PAF20065.1 hypothetical protein CHH49_18130 [Terribacillus saccharophilus]
MTPKVLILSLVFLLSFTSSTLAASYYGTTGESTNYIWADSTYGDDSINSVSYASCSANAEIMQYKNVGGKATYTSSVSISGKGAGSVSLSSGTNAIKLKSNDGGQVYLTKATTSNPNSPTIEFTDPGTCSSAGDSGGDSGGSSGGSDSGECDSCAVFTCPGWGQYMGKLEAIKDAIPPAPNWNSVADTFRDSIAPQVKADLQEVLGKAPNLPSEPDMPSGLDDRDLRAPEGKEAAGLGGASFDKDDLKDGEKIKENPDKSGGFDIMNPLENLPTDGPDGPKVEGEAPKDPKVEAEAPKNPVIEGEAPAAPEIEGEAPKDPVIEGEAPAAPEIEGEAPKDPVIEGEAPTNPDIGRDTPKDPVIEGEAPAAPKESTRPAPVPDSQSEENNSGYPMPGGNSSGYPMPGSNSGGYPMPGSRNYDAPMPSR